MPLYSGGNNPTVTPSLSPTESGTTAYQAVLPFPLSGTAAQGGWFPERYYRGRRAVLPPLLPLLVPQNPTRENALSSRGGSKTEQQRYYRRVLQAVLPLKAHRRYYR